MMYEYYIDNIKFIGNHIDFTVANNFRNDFGPSVIIKDNYGKILQEKYWLNYEIHREDGPAIIRYNESYNLPKKQYWLCGLEYSESKHKFIVENGMAKINPRNWSFDFILIYNFRFK